MKPMLHTAQERALWNETHTFAAEAHMGQRRKYTGVPYISHPYAVACAISEVPGRPMWAVQMGLLHDVVEDTAVHATEIDLRFGRRVEEAVRVLTDVQVPGMSRADRKAATRLRFSEKAGYWERVGKLCDIRDNLVGPSGIIVNDPNFAGAMIAEVKLLVPHLLVAGFARPLYAEVLALLEWEKPVDSYGTVHI